MHDYFNNESILGVPPVKRAAYSDRTAWILSELSRLAYEPLPAEQSMSELLFRIREAVRAEHDNDVLSALVRRAEKTGAGDVDEKLEDILKRARFELVDDFSVAGTEGMIVCLHPCEHFEGMLVVIFRGTQRCFKDVRTDLKANLVAAPGGGRVHAGFFEAFERVRDRIKTNLEKFKDLPAYFTGHSLGGALALVTTRYLGADSVGATYTFGCPRVADDDFFCCVKTPVYRVVNSTDFVSRLPFGFGFTLFLDGLRLLPINGTFQISEWLRKQLSGYTHHGDLIFLRPAAPINHETGKPRYELLIKRSPNIFAMAATVVPRWIASRGRSGLADHAIAQYSLKLHDYAEWRSRQEQELP